MPVTVRYTAQQLTAVNEAAAKRGLDRVNFLRAGVGKSVNWEPAQVEPVTSEEKWIPVTIRMPKGMAEAAEREARRLGLDRGSFCRMVTIRETEWDPE